MKIKCPICGVVTTWEENPYKPFCSERCKLQDLGAWFAEQYSIAGQPVEEPQSGHPEEDSRAEDQRGN